MRKVLTFLEVVLCLALTSALLAAAGVIVLPAAGDVLSAGTATPRSVTLPELSQRSEVYDAYGNRQATLYGEQNRELVPLASIPQQVIDSILSVEDERFWEHEGVNVRSTVRALFQNVSSGGVQQGASTITMQLVKLEVLGQERTESLQDKVVQAVLAVELENQMSKRDILERYLNTVYFGNGAYGVQAAAEIYWGKDVQDLDWGEAALLAALIRSPNEYNPVTDPDLAAERRRLALDRVVDEGFLTEEQASLYAFTPLPTQLAQVTLPVDDYFNEKVKQLLLDDPRFGLGETYEERYQAVFSGGLRVYTTYDPIMQELARQARDDVLPGDVPGGFVFSYQGVERQGTAVVVTVDVETGAVRALVGGPDFDTQTYDIATQGIGRQGGSSFKTFVLAAAMESGYVPTDTISGSGPCRFPNPGGNPDPYVVENFGNSGGGTNTIRGQVQVSSNCAFVRLGQIVGLNRVVEVARRMGITTPLNASALSMPLGAFEVLPVEMAGAYATIANDGIHNEPYYIERIEDAEGNVLYQHAPNGTRALSRQSARLAAEVLAANVTGGTGTRARIANQPSGGKTGTAQDSADAWFVGFTPQYATAVWMGAVEGRIPVRIGGVGITGGNFPAQIWGRYMSAVLANTPRAEFAAPERTRAGRFIRLPGEADQSTRTTTTGGRRTTTTTRTGTPQTTSPRVVTVPPTTSG